LAKWVADEKSKTNTWCEEQKAVATKERRAAAKQVYFIYHSIVNYPLYYKYLHLIE
jgi:hypothetical protein